MQRTDLPILSERQVLHNLEAEAEGVQILQEKGGKEMKQICANCEHNKRTYDGHCNAEFCCDNENSEYYAVPTSYDDTCDDWQEKNDYGKSVKTSIRYERKCNVMKGEILEITSKQAWEFLKPRHYAGRKPSISKAFAWVIDDKTVAVCTFGKPASNSLCVGICGEQYSPNVYELNRLCRIEELKEPLSEFVGACLRKLKDQNWIIVSYSDTGMHHNGYIYQALNFLYTGQTKQRTDKWTEGNKHSRHYSNAEQGKYRKVRTAKNRYVYFATHSKNQKKKWLNALNYPILPYPKEKNQNYILGEYQKPILVPIEKG